MKGALFWLTVTGTLPILVIGALVSIVLLAEDSREPSPTVRTCPPCPTTADNAKLLEAHASCDARAKEWERRALKGTKQ